MTKHYIAELGEYSPGMEPEHIIPFQTEVSQSEVEGDTCYALCDERGKITHLYTTLAEDARQNGYSGATVYHALDHNSTCTDCAEVFREIHNLPESEAEFRVTIGQTVEIESAGGD